MKCDQFLSTFARVVALDESLQNWVAGGKIPRQRLAAAVVLDRGERHG